MNFVYGMLAGCTVLTIIQIIMYIITNRNEYKLPQDVDNSSLQFASEWRTFIANKFINQILFWLDRDISEVEVKLTTPFPNIDSLCLIADNLELITTFKWEEGRAIISARISDGEDLQCYSKQICLKNFDVDSNTAFKFIKKVQTIHDHLNRISMEDIEDLWLHLRETSRDDSRKNIDLFNATADLMLLMRKKKFRRDKEVLRIHTELVRHIMNYHKDEFIEFLKLNNEDDEGKE